MSYQRFVIIIAIVFGGFLWFVLVVYKILDKYDQVTEIKVRELRLICLTLLVTGVVSAFIVHKQKIVFYLIYLFYTFLYGIVRNVVAGGLFAGFMTTAQLGYLYYLFVVPRFVFDNFEDSFFLEHHQKRVGAMSSFFIGQFVMFTSVYYRPIHRQLVRPDCIFLLFMMHLIIQILWVRLTLVRYWRFLYPNDKRKRVVRRIILIQLEFMCNFVLQLSLLPSNSYIEPVSRVGKLVNNYIFRKGNKIVANMLFIKASFVGWLIGHIFFMMFYIKLFGLVVMITIWLINWFRKNYFDK